MSNSNFLTLFMMIYHQSILQLITNISAFFSIFFYFLICILGVRVYIIFSSDIQKKILSKIRYSTHIDENNTPLRYFFDTNYIGYYNENDRKLFLICSYENYKKVLKISNENKTVQNENNYGEDNIEEIKEKEIKEEYITIFYKNNQTDYVYYKQREFNVQNFKSIKHQQKTIDLIIKNWNDSSNKSIVCMLYGEPNTGKSMVSILLAKKLKGKYCKTFKPTDPGDSIDTIYNTCFPTIMSPLIILLDEFDIILDNIHNQKLTLREKVLTQVTDKISWNQFFDNISIGFYPYTIFILTTNLNPKFINEKYDNSYIRKNRCHLFIEMKYEEDEETLMSINETTEL